MKKYSALAISAGAVIFSGSALAGPFTMNAGQGETSPIDRLEMSSTLATSIFDANPFEAPANILDTNISSTIDSSVPGGMETFESTSNPDPDAANFEDPEGNFRNRNVTGLDFTTGAADEGGNWTAGTPDTLRWGTGDPSSGDEFFWGLTFDYEFTGAFSETSPFDDGFMNLYYTEYDSSSDQLIERQVLRLNVEGSRLGEGLLVVDGQVSFDFAGSDDAFVQNFFRDVDSDETFYELYNNPDGENPRIPLAWILDTSVSPFLSEQGLVEFSDGEETAWVRQTRLNADVRFQVPEPSALMLLGLGLVGLGVFAHRRRKADVSNLAA